MHTEQKWLPLLSRAAACGLAGVVLTLMLSWLAAFAVNRELPPEVGAMTWAVWMIGYLILKASVGAPLFCAETAVTLAVALAASIIGSCIFHKKLRNRTKKKKRKQSRKYRK